MKVDIKEKIKEEMMLRELPNNHRSIFEDKLKNEFRGKSRQPKAYLMIAASIIMLFSLGYIVSNFQLSPKPNLESSVSKVSLKEFSPELKKIENYYLTAINFEIANLEVTDENKIMLGEYFRKLNGLTKEYEAQSEKLEIDKIDEELINNLIDNLQMRLHLMIELKKELKKLKSSENEELTV